MRARTVQKFRNIYTNEIAEYKKREIVDGGYVLNEALNRTERILYTVHILLRSCSGGITEDRWGEKEFKECWERVNPC